MPEEPYYRINREFYRLGRAYQPYHDKRFLRFGRSQQPDVDDIVQSSILQPNEPYYSRKKRSTHNLLDQPAEVANSFGQSDAEILSALDGDNRVLTKRGVSSESQDSVDKRFMRFGRGLQLQDALVKRFMRFGKRFMRFGRDPVKRFMRFGRNWEPEKRFMRFGRELEASKRFMRFGKRENNEHEKRFYRFGKSLDAGKADFVDNDKARGIGDIDEKRFMRFGKRFMRFGKRDTDAVKNDGVHTL